MSLTSAVASVEIPEEVEPPSEHGLVATSARPNQFFILSQLVLLKIKINPFDVVEFLLHFRVTHLLLFNHSVGGTGVAATKLGGISVFVFVRMFVRKGERNKTKSEEDSCQHDQAVSFLYKYNRNLYH